MMGVFRERRILILVLAYLLAMTGYLGNVYWIPTFVKRVSGFSNQIVTSLLMIPAMMGVFRERRILILVLAYLLAMTGYLGNVYWIPTFVKRVSGFSNQTVTSLLMIPAMMGILGMLINGWHSDKTNERHWHTGIPVLAAGLMFFLSSSVRHGMNLTIVFLLLGTGFLFAYFPTFWAIPTAVLGEAAAAASFGLINSIGQLGGFTGNYAIGFLNDRTHSLTASFAFIGLVYFAAGGLILSLRVRDLTSILQGSNSSKPESAQ
jgi:ACS family tartrate transporter-like MFS transporter